MAATVAYDLVPVGIASVVNHVLFPVQARIGEISHPGVEITGGVRDYHIRPVLERIILNGSAESHGG